jgi:hypothetical protein
MLAAFGAVGVKGGKGTFFYRIESMTETFDDIRAAGGSFVVPLGTAHTAEYAIEKQAILLVLMSGTAAVHNI